MKPFFADFSNWEIYTSPNGRMFSEKPQYKADLLAYAIPAESFAAGANRMSFGDNVDMASEYEEDSVYLPESDRTWVHSTFVQRPYRRTRGLYKAIVEKCNKVIEQ